MVVFNRSLRSELITFPFPGNKLPNVLLVFPDSIGTPFANLYLLYTCYNVPCDYLATHRYYMIVLTFKIFAHICKIPCTTKVNIHNYWTLHRYLYKLGPLLRLLQYMLIQS